MQNDIFNTKILLPLGISFYTFQILSYQIDLYRKKVEQIKSLKEFSFFVLFFPQVIAGPIVRANEFFPQIKNLFRTNHSRLIIYTFGLLLCVQGIVKKVVFADSLAPYSDAIFNNTPADVFTAWLGSYLFAFQICGITALRQKTKITALLALNPLGASVSLNIII